MEKVTAVLVHIHMCKQQMRKFLPKGTGYITDLGMTGPKKFCNRNEYSGII